jgi:hypothetical protein
MLGNTGFKDWLGNRLASSVPSFFSVPEVKFRDGTSNYALASSFLILFNSLLINHLKFYAIEYERKGQHH